MEPKKLYFDFRDIFHSPRLALSGKKIWIFLKANIVGFVAYWVMTYLALMLSGFSLSESIIKYGLYPCIYVLDDVSLLANINYWIGILIWIVAIFYACTAVSRITYKQLKGDDFYSVADARNFVNNHKYPVVMGWISILLIVVFFSIGAVVFALIGKIPYLGELITALLYIVYFFGALFTVYTLLVFITSIIYSPSIIATMEEDTMGTVFQSYSVAWSQPWRIIVYNLILMPLTFIALAIFKWFLLATYYLINVIFGAGWLMGAKLQRLVGWATELALPKFELCTLFQSCASTGETVGNSILLSLQEDVSFSGVEYIAATIIAIVLFILFLIILSYGMSVLSVGETIILTIFKKKSNDENLLLRKDEDDETEEESDDIATESNE